jgi:outer membrane lipoprotein-sorting protein
VISVSVVSRLAAQKGTSDSSFDAIYKRGQQFNSDLKSLTAHFTETTTSSLLTRPLVASGTLAVERPSRVVLHYLEPEPRDVLIEGDRMILSWPARHIREVINIATTNRRLQKYFVNSSPEQLREIFTITTRTGGDQPHTYQLTMVPERKQIREGLSKLDLWIDDASMLLSAMQMTFPNGDSKLLRFDGVVVNQPVDPSAFVAAK